MPDMPQLKKFPYETTKRCTTCHPSRLPEPPFFECVMETAHSGTQVVRQLECPNCGQRDADVYDTRIGRVTFDHDLDIKAARMSGL